MSYRNFGIGAIMLMVLVATWTQPSTADDTAHRASVIYVADGDNDYSTLLFRTADGSKEVVVTSRYSDRIGTCDRLFASNWDRFVYMIGLFDDHPHRTWVFSSKTLGFTGERWDRVRDTIRGTSNLSYREAVRKIIDAVEQERFLASTRWMKEDVEVCLEGPDLYDENVRFAKRSGTFVPCSERDAPAPYFVAADSIPALLTFGWRRTSLDRICNELGCDGKAHPATVRGVYFIEVVNGSLTLDQREDLVDLLYSAHTQGAGENFRCLGYRKCCEKGSRQ